MPLTHDDLKVTDQQARKLSKRPPTGKVLAVLASIAVVQPLGSANQVPCQYDGVAGVSEGKYCTYEWRPDRKKYVISAVWTLNDAVTPVDRPPGNYQLAPPNNLRTHSDIAGAVLIEWDVPPQQDIVFEIEKNSATMELGAESILTTRGGQALYGTADPLYFRARSVTSTLQYSSWSAWVLGTPGTTPVTISAEPICFNGELLFFNGDILMMGV